jgi:hypothetical protein
MASRTSSESGGGRVCSKLVSAPPGVDFTARGKLNPTGRAITLEAQLSLLRSNRHPASGVIELAAWCEPAFPARGKLKAVRHAMPSEAQLNENFREPAPPAASSLPHVARSRPKRS